MTKQYKTINHRGLSRREVLKSILFTPPVLLFGQGCLFSDQEPRPLFPPRIIPQGQKIRAAAIGVYNRGAQVIDEFRQFPDQVEFVAFADVAFMTADASVRDFPDVPCFRDYRQMFEQMHEQIDAVIISTPDHAHFAPIMHAMLLGKHVYVEKPMAQNVYECRLLDKTARACGVVTQMGNQGHSKAGTIQFGKWVDAGLFKNARRIDAWMTGSRRWHGWTDKAYPEEIPPIGYDWDQWLGRRPFRPYSEKMINGNWRCWFEFGCGAMGDWGAHILDAIHRYYLNRAQPYEICTQLTGPSELLYPQASVITFKFHEQDGHPPVELNWYDGQGNKPAAQFEFIGKLGDAGSLIYAQDFVIRGGSHGSNYRIQPAEKMTQLQNAGQLPEAPPNLSNHFQNFLNACQGLEQANSRFEIAAPLAELLCLGCIGQRFGGTLKYDAQAMAITNHPEADRMLKGPDVRDGWQAYDKQHLVKSKKSQIKSPDAVTWENLFQDKNLSNWENPYEWGKAEYVDGEVHLTTDQKGWFLITRKSYANFILEAQVLMPVGKGNAGFIFRCQKTKNRVWGYQAEVDTAARKWSGGLYDEARRGWFISPNRDHAATPEERDASIAEFRARAGECFKQGQWNKYRIICIGSHIRIYVNDILTTDIHDEMDLAGPVGIQHHGEKGLVYKYRSLRIKDLGAGGEVYYPHRENARPAAVPSKLAGAIYEAESANKLHEARIFNTYSGYQGTGYVCFTPDAGGSVEWDNVLADTAGQFKLTFRYAASDDRSCDLYINEENVGKLQCVSTGAWTKWQTVEKVVSFQTGRNTVRIATAGSGLNLDAMAVNKA
ncbi:MAG TPA: DUF1080 domain-containing protein [Anaerohalosphaeraceae bacterium]|nr:DUF1080 domain-containing protein [Anaerohalosphaeraceae bacterium]